ARGWSNTRDRGSARRAGAYAALPQQKPAAPRAQQVFASGQERNWLFVDFAHHDAGFRYHQQHLVLELDRLVAAPPRDRALQSAVQFAELHRERQDGGRLRRGLRRGCLRVAHHAGVDLPLLLVVERQRARHDGNAIARRNVLVELGRHGLRPGADRSVGGGRAGRPGRAILGGRRLAAGRLRVALRPAGVLRALLAAVRPALAL